ncbi:uncharacterized protein FPOAC1_013559 [Fusarium poae]|jgi:hypothetical protein|uniref:uncharacterized protein n=1 Tax=Fusarium poae TaxID=36050 RepID=UPI001D043403|nr:uncharacterized protein FPOAC1_013559 [Fusarium poae]KAG8664779.1 hypothetical protein FPOAC1_013559 [Fusarium poae]
MSSDMANKLETKLSGTNRVASSDKRSTRRESTMLMADVTTVREFGLVRVPGVVAYSRLPILRFLSGVEPLERPRPRLQEHLPIHGD